MAVIQYRDKDGKLKALTLTVSSNSSDVHIGNEEPIDPSCKVWYDTSTDVPLSKCKLPSGDWVVVAGGGSDVDYITDEEYEKIMNEVGI